MKGWMWLTLGTERFLVFGYTDPTAGPSAKGVALVGEPTPEQIEKVLSFPGSTFRMPMGASVALSAVEIGALGLPEQPDWMQFYPQPSTPWSDDPRLEFHPAHPNDLQAMFFMPLLGTVESMWVELVAEDTAIGGYVGTLLNDAHGDPSLRSGAIVAIRPTPGVAQPIWVSDIMRRNLGLYAGACEACGFDLVLVGVETLIASTFPDVPPGALLEQFTTRCAMCNGTQLLRAVPN